MMVKDLICGECGKNFGKSPGAKGMLQMHNKFKHPEKFWDEFMGRSSSKPGFAGHGSGGGT